jgi:hypothetical protein
MKLRITSDKHYNHLNPTIKKHLRGITFFVTSWPKIKEIKPELIIETYDDISHEEFKEFIMSNYRYVIA